MQNKAEENKVEKKVISILAEQLGVENQDIKPEDSFVDDLHMSAADITEFALKLQEKEIKIESVELGNYETVGEFIEALSSELEFS